MSISGGQVKGVKGAQPQLAKKPKLPEKKIKLLKAIVKKLEGIKKQRELKGKKLSQDSQMTLNAAKMLLNGKAITKEEGELLDTWFGLIETVADVDESFKQADLKRIDSSEFIEGKKPWRGEKIDYGHGSKNWSINAEGKIKFAPTKPIGKLPPKGKKSKKVKGK